MNSVETLKYKNPLSINFNKQELLQRKCSCRLGSKGVVVHDWVQKLPWLPKYFLQGIQVSATDLGNRVMILEMVANKCVSDTRNFNKLT